MQMDMHYFGTYAMARAAGMSRDAAQVAASAAQYVDDNVARTPVVLTDGARLARVPTAHHVSDEISNIQPDDQRNVWVPFHFLPGIEPGAGGLGDYEELLKCRKNSEPARWMIDWVVANVASDTLALERVGVTAHVYADTFSHYGFAGVSSQHNKVDATSFRFSGLEPEVAELLHNKAKDFFRRFGEKTPLFRHAGKTSRWWAWFKSLFAETVTGALGHGAVATYPDLPYLSWSFAYEHPTRIPESRNNTDTFLEACAALYDFFRRVAEVRDDFTEGTARPFEEIKAAVVEVLACRGDSDERAKAWCDAAAAGKLFAAPETIPPYLGDDWSKWLDVAENTVTSTQALDHPACRFHLAANAHRSWVLHELLPARNLLVA
jgi:hypothetical protein